MAKRSKKPDGVARELERTGELCLAFANTGALWRDDRRRASAAGVWTRLDDYTDLVAWGQRMGILGARDGKLLTQVAAEQPVEAQKALGRALKLRASLMRLFTLLVCGKQVRPADLDPLNAALANALPPPSAPPSAASRFTSPLSSAS